MAKTSRVAAAAPVEPAPPPPPALSVPAPVIPPVSNEPATIIDAFDAAFAEAAAAEVEAATAPKKGAPKPAEPLAPIAQPEPTEEPPAPAEPQPEPSPPPPPPQFQPQPPPPPPPPPQFQPQPPPPPPQPQPQVHDQPLFNAEEAAQLQTFFNDWPDVARATETMVRGIVMETTRRIYADMAASLAPYLRTVDTLADRSQLSELQGQVPDYETVAGQLTSWAARQPAYLRAAYEHVIKSGTAAEVVDLINRYKSDMQSTTPAQAAQPTPAAPAPAAPAPAPVNPALAAAAARLAPVATKRTNVVAPPTDFDTAFAEFARAN